MSMLSARRSKGQVKGAGRREEVSRIYANPLPLIFTDPAEHKALTLLSSIGLSLTKVTTPHCAGVFDPSTRSVWVTDSKDSTLLWRRGFFGKGDLSRSEPSWLARQKTHKQPDGRLSTAEEVTAKRRAERRQFKLDRAKAIAAVAEEAEKIFMTEGRVIQPALTGPAIPSAATWRPPSPTSASADPLMNTLERFETSQEPVQDIEHLQLSLPEAFFLLWCLDCLTVLDANTNEALSLGRIWAAFQSAHLLGVHAPPCHFDNPFLVNYFVYHHYRSLGWVVRSGIKFCVDYLLYKRGPVFSHAEFAVVICPVYEDPEDRASSPFERQTSSLFSWSWLSTINRVNSQVQKTLILTYVTIPARSRVPLHVLESPACLQYYSIRDVVLRRFIPARMRD